MTEILIKDFRTDFFLGGGEGGGVGGGSGFSFVALVG